MGNRREVQGKSQKKYKCDLKTLGESKINLSNSGNTHNKKYFDHRFFSIALHYAILI